MSYALCGEGQLTRATAKQALPNPQQGTAQHALVVCRQQLPCQLSVLDGQLDGSLAVRRPTQQPYHSHLGRHHLMQAAAAVHTRQM